MMAFDWDRVKEKTLWHYDKLIKKILEVFKYEFALEHYNHPMAEAVKFAERVKKGYLHNGNESSFVIGIIPHFKSLKEINIKDYLDLVHQVETQAKCEFFIQQTNFNFESLIDFLNYLFRWVLPTKCSLSDLVDDGGSNEEVLDSLKECKIRSNLDLLENCRTGSARSELAEKTETDEGTILKLAHRADISRLAFVRGKTVKHLCGGGYDTLDKLANTDLAIIEKDMSNYYQTIGKTLKDFNAVIPLDWMAGGAKIMPRVIMY